MNYFKWFSPLNFFFFSSSLSLVGSVFGETSFGPRSSAWIGAGEWIVHPLDRSRECGRPRKFSQVGRSIVQHQRETCRFDDQHNWSTNYSCLCVSLLFCGFLKMFLYYINLLFFEVHHSRTKMIQVWLICCQIWVAINAWFVFFNIDFTVTLVNWKKI